MQNSKRIPWADLQEYLKVHNEQIVPLIEQKKNGSLSEAEVENNLSLEMLKVHLVVSEICLRNKIYSLESTD